VRRDNSSTYAEKGKQVLLSYAFKIFDFNKAQSNQIF